MTKKAVSISDIHDYRIDAAGRQIFLMGEEKAELDDDGTGEPGVEYQMANRFIRNMTILNTASTPITIHMKSCGGDWREGRAIYDTIRASPCKTVILSYTHARSMSSIILQAATRRVLMPNSIMMFHEGSAAYAGTTKQFITEANELAKASDIMDNIYIDRMVRAPYWRGKSRNYIKSWLHDNMNIKEEVYLNADEAVRYGLADAVIGRNGISLKTLTKGL